MEPWRSRRPLWSWWPRNLHSWVTLLARFSFLSRRACLPCLAFLSLLSWAPHVSVFSLHSCRPHLSWGALGTRRAHVSWFASRSLFPIESWRAWQSNLPLLTWDPWSSRWADLARKTRWPHQGQRPDLLESLTDVSIVIHHLTFPWFSLGALGASWSLSSSCSRLPLVSLLSRGATRATYTSFSLWPWRPREPWGAGLPSASSNGVASVSFLSLLSQEAE